MILTRGPRALSSLCLTQDNVNTDAETPGAPYSVGAVHSDANCAVLVDGLIKRTNELVVKGLTLQQRSRIANHIRTHREALAERAEEHVPDEQQAVSHEVTWTNHGAELLVARSVVTSLIGASVIAQKNEDFAAGMCDVRSNSSFRFPS